MNSGEFRMLTDNGGDLSGQLLFANNAAWRFIVMMGVLCLTLLIANILRKKIKFIKNSLLPVSVIAGILIIVLKAIQYIPGLNNYFDNFMNLFFENTEEMNYMDYMSIVTYHCLGLSFIAIALKTTNKKEKDRKKALIITKTGAMDVATYLIQAIVGLIITGLVAVIAKGDIVEAASGVLLPMGYGQGPGQALNFGAQYEFASTQKGGTFDGTNFGLSIASIGFIVACLFGVVYLNILKRKGKIQIKQKADVDFSKSSDVLVEEPDSVALNESIDRLTIQIILILFVYLVTYGFIYGTTYLCNNFLGNFGNNTLTPLLWGFNFLFGTIFAIVLKVALKGLRKKNVMTKVYPNNFLLNRLSGVFCDIMIVSAMAAIDLKSFANVSFIVPLTLVCVVGAFATFYYLLWISKKTFKGYEYEGFFSMFGMLTGTASTGMILLREVDPNYETPAANNLVMQAVPAILFGFPLLLLVPLAKNSWTMWWITLGASVVMFVAYNCFIIFFKGFRKKDYIEEEKISDEVVEEEIANNTNNEIQ